MAATSRQRCRQGRAIARDDVVDPEVGGAEIDERRGGGGADAAGAEDGNDARRRHAEVATVGPLEAREVGVVGEAGSPGPSSSVFATPVLTTSSDGSEAAQADALNGTVMFTPW